MGERLRQIGLAHMLGRGWGEEEFALRGDRFGAIAAGEQEVVVDAVDVSQVVEVLRQRDRLLDEHRFRSSGNLVVSNLDRIAEIDNVGN